MLVVGSNNSSNSNRLVEVSRNLAHNAYLIDQAEAIEPEWLEGVNTVAVTAGASAPEVLVQDVIDYLQETGYGTVDEVEVMPENVRFGLPPEIVQAIAVGAAHNSGERLSKPGGSTAPRCERVHGIGMSKALQVAPAGVDYRAVAESRRPLCP